MRNLPQKGQTYKESGVDIAEAGEAVKEIWKLIPKTFNLNPNLKVVPVYSHYGGVIDIGLPESYLVVKTDSVGSKVIIAELLNKYDTVGIDCIAMNVNDLICIGATPLAFIDYYAVEKVNAKIASQIMKGLVDGATQSKIAIVAGETASLPDVIKGVDGKGFDLAGMAVGIVPKNNLILGDKIELGDIVIGIESSGLHSNGFSLARKVLLEKFTITEVVEGIKLSEELIRPTFLYNLEVLESIKETKIHGLANITGGAFMKLGRLIRHTNKKLGIKLDSFPEPPAIFKLIQKIGNISNYEMYKTFNMGIGFCIFAPNSEYEKISRICKKYGKRTYKIGSVSNENKIILQLKNETIEYPIDKF